MCASTFCHPASRRAVCVVGRSVTPSGVVREPQAGTPHETMIVVRKLGAVATVVMTLTLVARTSSTAPSPKSSASWTGSFVAALVTSTKTVSRADLSRFVAPAHKGLREPLEAAYRFDPPLDSPTGQLRSFRVWYEPVVGSGPEGNFVHETPFGQGTFRFIKNGRGQVLRVPARGPSETVEMRGAVRSAEHRARHAGRGIPVAHVGRGEPHYRPPWPAGLVPTNRARATPVVSEHPGRKLSLCTKTGQLALDAKWFVGSSQLELVSLALTESKSAFLLPARPTPWGQGVLPNLCGKRQCPSLGML